MKVRIKHRETGQYLSGVQLLEWCNRCATTYDTEDGTLSLVLQQLASDRVKIVMENAEPEPEPTSLWN